MPKEEKKSSSLTHHETSRIRFSQIVIVVLLVIGILIAVVIAIPKSWQAIFSNNEEKSSFVDIIEETAVTGQIFQEDISKVLDRIEDLKAIDEEVAQQQIEVFIPAKVDDENSRATKYINYDWNVSFSLPSEWSYNANKSAFISENSTLTVKRMSEFILPEIWEPMEVATTSKVLSKGTSVTYYKEEGVDAFFATIANDIYTYIFTTTSTDTFSDEQKSIITSLQTL